MFNFFEFNSHDCMNESNYISKSEAMTRNDLYIYKINF